MKERTNFGNFKDPELWSKKAKKVANTIAIQYCSLTATPPSSAKSELLSLYNQKDYVRVTNLRKELIEELYSKTLPMSFKMTKKLENNLDALIADELRYLKKIGMIHYDGHNSPGKIFKQIERNIYLVPLEGMPIKDFLIWYKGCKTDPVVLQEWSGIPKEEFSRAYEALLRFLNADLFAKRRISQKSPERPHSFEVGDVLLM